MTYLNDPIIRDIEESNYQISENGELYNKKNGRPRKWSISGNGYLHTIIRINNDKKDILMHNLLAKLFIKNPHNYFIVDHINTIKTDNTLENLRWCTSSQNATNTNLRKDNKLKIKNITISYDNKNGYRYKYYYATIMKNKKKYAKRFEFSPEGLEKAIIWRDETIAKYHTYD